MSDEIVETLRKKLAPLLEVVRIESVNWKVDGKPGHPFMIGPEHVKEAADHHCGMLGLDVTEKIGCAYKEKGREKCGAKGSAHTHERAALLQLTRHAAKSEVVALLKTVMSDIQAAKVDGFVFVDTPEKYRFK